MLRAHAVRDEGRPRAREGPFRRRSTTRSSLPPSPTPACSASARTRSWSGGIIHKPMFERLLLCEYAVADLSMANPNVYYELGIRHATRPWSTVLLFARRLHAAVRRAAPARRALPARRAVGPTPPTWQATERRSPTGCATRARARRTARLFQLLTDLAPPDTSGLGAELFRERVEAVTALQNRLAAARQSRDLDAMQAVRADLGDLDDTEAGLMIDLLQSYLSVAAYATRWTSSPPCPRSSPDVADPREARLRAQPSRPTRRGRRHPLAVDRRARPGQRDLRPARPGLQGPVGGGAPGRTDPARRRAARQGDRGLPRRVRGRLARPLPGHQRGAADAPARPGGHPDRRDAPGGPLQRAAEGAAAPCRLLGPRHPPRARRDRRERRRRVDRRHPRHLRPPGGLAGTQHAGHAASAAPDPGTHRRPVRRSGCTRSRPSWPASRIPRRGPRSSGPGA